MTGGKAFLRQSGTERRLGKVNAQLAAGKLPWAPPNVTYTDLHINLAMTSAVNTDIREVVLDSQTDYNLIFDEVIHQRIRFSGGRHVKMIGAEFNVDVEVPHTGYPASDVSYYENMSGPEFQGQTGTLFIEGLYVHGAYVTDCIRQPGGAATDLVIQNSRCQTDRVVTGVTTSPDGFYHTDGFQSWGGLRSMRAYNWTICNAYQGGMIGDGALIGIWGPTIWERVNLRPGAAGQASKLFNIVGNATYMKGPLSFKDVYYEIGSGTQWGTAYSLPTNPPYLFGAFYGGNVIGTDVYGRDYAIPPAAGYPGLRALDNGEGDVARIYRGLPPGGDYVPAGGTSCGFGYVSPGYVS